LFRKAHESETPFRGRSLPTAAGLLMILAFLTLAAEVHGTQGILPSDSSWFVDMNRFSRSAHAALTCEQCHPAMKEGGKKHPDLEKADSLRIDASRRFDYGLCKECHRVSYARFQKGSHASALEKELSGKERPPGEEPKKAPLCGDCHSAHYAQAGLSRVEVGRRMTEACGECHLPQKRSYLDDYHGRTGVHLGNEKAAYCTDCHGAHTAVSLKEREQALLACIRCHPKAEARFTDFVIHATTESLAQKDPAKQQSMLLIYRVKVIASIFLGVILFFFFGHTFLWILRELHEQLRKR
jgi:hypothetical protein